MNKIDVESFVGYDAAAIGFDRIEKTGTVKAVTTEENRGSALSPDWWTVLDYNATAEVAKEKRDTIYVKPTSAFDCELTLTESYSKVFELGDIITVQNSVWNIIESKRITQITELYDSNKTQIKATIGEPLKSLSEIMRSR